MIFHLTTDELYQRALAEGRYRHPSLASEGFIHLCTKSQLNGVVERFFPAEQTEFLTLCVVEKRLGQDVLKWEEVPSSGDTFPHCFGAIPLAAIEDVALLARLPSGQVDVSPLPGS